MDEKDTGWSIGTLYAHFSRIVSDMDKLSDAKFKTVDVALKSVEQSASAALAASERATNKAEGAIEKRFDGVNEFRQTLGDQANKFITRDEVQTRVLAQDKEMAALVSRLDRMEAAKDSVEDKEKAGSDRTSLWIAVGAMLAAFLAAAIAGIGLFAALYHKV